MLSDNFKNKIDESSITSESDPFAVHYILRLRNYENCYKFSFEVFNNEKQYTATCLTTEVCIATSGEDFLYIDDLYKEIENKKANKLRAMLYN